MPDGTNYDETEEPTLVVASDPFDIDGVEANVTLRVFEGYIAR